jgi:hypothetical protein
MDEGHQFANGRGERGKVVVCEDFPPEGRERILRHDTIPAIHLPAYGGVEPMYHQRGIILMPRSGSPSVRVVPCTLTGSPPRLWRTRHPARYEARGQINNDREIHRPFMYRDERRINDPYGIHVPSNGKVTSGRVLGYF